MSTSRTIAVDWDRSGNFIGTEDDIKTDACLMFKLFRWQYKACGT